MSRRMTDSFPEMQAVINAARAMGEDIAKTKGELERLVNMIVKNKIIEIKKVSVKRLIDGKEQTVSEEQEIEREATVEDMISATMVLVLQDEKFRRYVPGELLKQLMDVSDAVRNYEKRGLTAILPAIKGGIRRDLINILHKAYPAWNSLVPDATTHTLNAMIAEKKNSTTLKGLPFGDSGAKITEF